MSEQSNEEQLKQIKDKTGKKYDHSELHINRVPDHAIQDLKDLAYERFCGDYGMALAFLIELNNLKNDFDKKLVANTEKTLELQEKVQRLEQKIEESEEDGKNNSKVDTIR